MENNSRQPDVSRQDTTSRKNSKRELFWLMGGANGYRLRRGRSPAYMALSFFSMYTKSFISSLVEARMYRWKAWMERCPDSDMT